MRGATRVTKSQGKRSPRRKMVNLQSLAPEKWRARNCPQRVQNNYPKMLGEPCKQCSGIGEMIQEQNEKINKEKTEKNQTGHQSRSCQGGETEADSHALRHRGLKQQGGRNLGSDPPADSRGPPGEAGSGWRAPWGRRCHSRPSGGLVL